MIRVPVSFRALLVVGFLALLTGCGSGPAAEERAERLRGPILESVGSILLEESDSAYIGEPFSLVIDPDDGSFYISDFFSNRVFRFDRGGTLVARIGRPGGGPGEFRSVGLTFLLDDTTLVAADDNNKRLLLFDRRDGSFREHRAFAGVIGPSAPAARNGTVWIPSRELAGGTSVLKWELATGEMHHLVPLPEMYMESARGIGRFASFRPHGTLTLWADTLLVGMGGTNALTLSDTRGTVLDTVSIPAIRRRGVPANVLEIFQNVRSTQQDIFEASSALRHVHRLPAGNFALVHHDSHLEGRLPGGLITATIYVSVLSADRKRACVDTLLPASKDARPIHGFRGDTLFHLDRRIVDDERLETRIELYRITTDGCDWLPTNA